MANKKFWLGMLVLVLVFGMTVVGCDNGSTSGNSGNGGIFTLTDIPAAYNGKYASFLGESESSDDFIIGCQRVNMSTETFTLSQISNGRVNIPLWTETSTGSISKYSGNGTFVEAIVEIWDTATISWEGEPIAEIYFPSITFSNGSATKSANDGEIDY